MIPAPPHPHQTAYRRPADNECASGGRALTRARSRERNQSAAHTSVFLENSKSLKAIPKACRTHQAVDTVPIEKLAQPARPKRYPRNRPVPHQRLVGDQTATSLQGRAGATAPHPRGGRALPRAISRERHQSASNASARCRNANHIVPCDALPVSGHRHPAFGGFASRVRRWKCFTALPPASPDCASPWIAASLRSSR